MAGRRPQRRRGGAPGAGSGRAAAFCRQSADEVAVREALVARAPVLAANVVAVAAGTRTRVGTRAVATTAGCGGRLRRDSSEHLVGQHGDCLQVLLLCYRVAATVAGRRTAARHFLHTRHGGGISISYAACICPA